MSTESTAERIRRARSLNDILGIVKDIAFTVSDIRSSVSVSTSASKSPQQPKSVVIDHTKGLDDTAPINLGAKLSKFKMPNISVVAKHTKSMQMLHESANDIDSIIASLEHTFSHAKSKAAALRSAQAVQKETHMAFSTVAQALNAIAEKHVPQILRDFADKIESQLHNIMDQSKYSKISMELYVTADDVAKTSSGTLDATIEFCYYVILHDLVLEDDSDNSQPVQEYCIMLTGVVKDDSIRYFLNAIPEFLPPGKYPAGKEIRNIKELTQRLKMLLSVHKIVGAIEQRPLPHDEEGVRVASIKGFPNVKSVSVDEEDQALIVNMITSKDGRGAARDSDNACQEVVRRVIPLLTPIQGTRKSSPVQVRYTIIREKGTKTKPRRTYIKFILVGKSVRQQDAQDIALTKSQLDNLQHSLDLSAAETKAISRIMIHHKA